MGDLTIRHTTLPISISAPLRTLHDGVIGSSQAVLGPTDSYPKLPTPSVATSVHDVAARHTTTPIHVSSTTFHGDCTSEEVKTAFEPNLDLSRRALPAMSFHDQAAKAMATMEATCNDIKVMNTHIDLLEGRLAMKDKELVEKDTLLLEVQFV
jgi:hypothetical protein